MKIAAHLKRLYTRAKLLRNNKSEFNQHSFKDLNMVFFEFVNLSLGFMSEYHYKMYLTDNSHLIYWRLLTILRKLFHLLDLILSRICLRLISLILRQEVLKCTKSLRDIGSKINHLLSKQTLDSLRLILTQQMLERISKVL